jgi:microcystin-dependent protein
MAFSTTRTREDYPGNGATTEFPVRFPWQIDADINALITNKNVSPSVSFELALNTDFNLEGAGESSGTLTFPTGTSSYPILPSGWTITIRRVPALTQESDLDDGDGMPAEVVETALDRTVMLCGALQEQIDRAVMYDVSTKASEVQTASEIVETVTAAAASASASAKAAKTSESEASASETAAAASASALPNAAGIGAGNVPMSTGAGWVGSSVGTGDMLKANNLSDLSDRVEARGNLGLGNCAVFDVGTSANNIVQLNLGAALPAVDGGNLTGMTAAQISGLPSSMPTGAVIAMATETVPGGFLECNGAAISRTIYATLYAAIGVVHGYGDNSTTFNLPDYRGRFLRGWDHAVARDPDKASRTAMNTGGATGDTVGSIQADAFRSHTHSCAQPSGQAYTYSGNGAVSSTSGATGGNETRPINANVMHCIKY